VNDMGALFFFFFFLGGGGSGKEIRKKKIFNDVETFFRRTKDNKLFLDNYFFF